MSTILKKDIAIIGMACRFPQAGNYHEYWENLLARKNCVSEIPSSRWDWRRYSGDPLNEVNKSNSRWGGFIEEVECFDYRFFGISPTTAEVMDPQQRIMLELSWACMEDAGIVPHTLAGRKVGVFLGAFNFDYKELLEKYDRPIEAYESTGTANAIIANRISHFYDFCGPSLTLDTACSASINAVHSALQSLALGESELALAGGVNLILTPTRHISFAKTGMLSPTGSSKSFDAAADGYVRGEGAGILLLKPLEAALADNDCIHGVLKGSAVNHCGKTHTLTYPDSGAQSKVITEALQKAQVSAETVTYVEAHGTGTPKGDPIEIQGLTSAYRNTDKAGYCAIGSAKSNIGHLEAAAGVAGIIKVLLSMKANTLPALANFNALNSNIQLSGTPFYVLDRTRQWPQITDSNGVPVPKRAGVSAFGFGGTNGHVVLEEAPVRNQNNISAIHPETALLFVFSAKTPNSLTIQLHNMREWFLKNQEQSLADISSTLVNHRTHFNNRVAIIASSHTALVNLLQVAIEKLTMGVNCNEPVYDIDQVTDENEKSLLITSAANWLKGGVLDHQPVVPESTQFARLPTYAFERTSCWIDFAEAHHGENDVRLPLSINETASTKVDGTYHYEMELNEMNSGVGKQALAAVWEPVNDGEHASMETATGSINRKSEKICVVGANLQYRKTLQEKYGDAYFFDPDEDPKDVLTGSMMKEVTHLIWITPRVQTNTASDLLSTKQKNQVAACFRWLKYFLAQGFSTEPLCLSLVTVQAFKSNENEQISADNSPLAGMFGSLSREYRHLNVRLFDILSDSALPLNVIGNTRLSFEGPRLYRNGQWLERCFVPIQWSEIDPLSANTAEFCIRDGVYLIVGGAGGIGQALSEYMIKNYSARVIWLGRRAADKNINTAISRLSSLGRAPEYIQVDATDFNALQAVYQDLVDRFHRVNGVINAAMVFKTCSFKDMSIADFESVYDAKAETSINLARILVHEDIDYLINFSSINSFLTAADQSHYAAGSVFQDALFAQLQRACKFKVKTVNWGYWTADGALAKSEIFQQWRRESGVGDLTVDDAIPVLEKLLRSQLSQIAYINALTQAANLPNTITDQRLNVGLDKIESYLEAGSINRFSKPPKKGLAGGLKFQESDDLVVNYMWQQLLNAGLIEEETFSLDSLLQRFEKNCSTTKASYLQRWLNKSIRILCERGILECQDPTDSSEKTGEQSTSQVFHVTKQGKQISSDTNLLARWEKCKADWIVNPATASQANLLNTTLQALPEILRGEKLSTQVMFPGSSMDLLEGIYKNNPVSDYFNSIVAEIVAHTVANLYSDNKKAKIIEIGAGTGGTSAIVFDRLRSVQNQVEEYCYTDISRAFLVHAQEHYKAQNAFLNTKIFNIENPVEGQEVNAGTYDIVIATNVLHATRNIHRTLRNAKALLKPGGIVVLNELSEDTVFCHMTFGLLEGWWLHEDSTLRIPECPGLTSLGWKRTLEKEGYLEVEFPQLGSHSLGQQIIVAKSNGITHENLTGNSRVTLESGENSARLHSVDPTPVVHPDMPETKTNPAIMEAKKLSPVNYPESESSQAKGKHSAFSVQHIKDTIRTVIANSLKYNADEVHMDESFADYGVDSITSVNVVQSLNEALELDLYSTCLFDYTSITRLAEYIVENYASVDTEAAPILTESTLDTSMSPGSAAPDAPIIAAEDSGFHNSVQSVEDHGKTDIAIIGASGRFGKASDLKELWSALANGEDLVEPVTRWDLREHYRGIESDQYCDAGALLERIDQFDPGFFNISPKEAAYMDPQQRLFMEECWNALEDAGVTDRSIDGAPVSIYVGCEAGDYENLFDSEPPPQSFWGNAPSIIPARISYHLNLKGPAVAIDTACSSSLVAIHSACNSLKNRDVNMAIAGGVFVQSTPEFYLKSNRANMLSRSGKCHTFDERADGFVPGEGVGVVILKRLDDAIADGDRIYGVIKASGINQDGASNGITAPSTVSQENLIKQTYGKYNINPEEIQFVEAHGTGTSLGDPIEFEALTRAFRHYTDKSAFSAIGSVKSNLGHAATAAGMAGLFKILLSLKHRKIPATLNYTTGNPKIQFDGSPFYVNTTLSDWNTEVGQPRKAAISSFGFSGTNAHIVIEEAPSLARTIEQRSDYLICLSAKTPEQLKLRARNLLEYLQTNQLLNCLDLSYTLLARRSHFDYRLSMVVRDISEIEKYLKQWVEEGVCNNLYENTHQSTQKPVRNGYFQYADDLLDASIKSGNANDYREALGMLAELFADGQNPVFEKIFKGAKALPVDVPGYPFDRKSIWIDQESKHSDKRSETYRSKLHPLVHRNESVFGDQVFRSEYTGNEYFLSEHVIHGKRILPGVCFIEMARASLAMSIAGFANNAAQFQGKSLLCKGVGWLRPWSCEKESNSLKVQLSHTKDSFEFVVETANVDPGGIQQDIKRYCSGELAWIDSPEHHVEDAGRASKFFNDQSLTGEQFYRYFEQCGIDYGNQFRRVSHMGIAGRECLARINVNTTVSEDQRDMLIEPGMFDGVLQSAAVLISRCFSLNQALVPIAIEELIIHKPINTSLQAHTRVLGDGANGSGVYKVDIQVWREDGAAVATIRGLSFRPMLKAVDLQAAPDKLAEPQYKTLVFGSTLQPVNVDESEQVDSLGMIDSDRIVITLSNDRATVAAGSDYDSCSVQLDQLAGQFTDAVKDEDSIDDSLVLKAEYLLLTIQLLMAQKHLRKIRLQLIASSGQSETAGKNIPSFTASLVSMLRTVELEDPRFRCRLIDSRNPIVYGSDASNWSPQIQRLANLALTASGDSYLLFENNGFYRENRSEMGFLDTIQDTCPWREKGVYLISGGAGGIGYAIADDIVRNVRSARILLLGTRKTDDEINTKLSRLNGLGGIATYHSVDVSNFNELNRFVQEISSEIHYISAILHCAGVTNDSLLAYKKSESLRSVFGPKVKGVINLDNATKHLEIDHFILFSSVSAVLGNVGQGDYAVANRFLDHYAGYRNRLQLSGKRTGRTLSINWPIWGTPGMNIDEPTLDRMYKEWGMVRMEPGEGIKALYKVLSLKDDSVFIMHGDSQRIRQLFDNGQSIDSGAFKKERIVSLVGEILGVADEDVDTQLHFDEYGLDWVQRNQLVDILRSELKCDIYKDALYIADTIDDLYAYILKHCSHAVSYKTNADSANNTDTVSLVPATADADEAIDNQQALVSGEQMPDSLVNSVVQFLKELVHQQTGISVEDIDPSIHFERYGIDSLMIVSMTNKLETICGRLPKTLFFEYNNLADLSDYFIKQYKDVLKDHFVSKPVEPIPAPQQDINSGEEQANQNIMAAPVVSDTASSTHMPGSNVPGGHLKQDKSATENPQSEDIEQIAIVGLAGRYPQADSLEEFWKNLVNGRDSITEVPFDRWDHSRYFDERKGVHGKTYSKWGGFIDGVDQFDPLFFNISPHDAEFMDPQERIFLQCVYHALEDAGYADIDCLQPGAVTLGNNVGVYVGVMYEEYQLYGAQESLVGTPISLGGSAASVANRVSFSFNFNGPSLAVDSMCSASLTSVYLACESILNGHCDAAVAGGVNLNLHPNKYLNLAQGNFASSDGRCKSFGADANGYVPGEGCGAIILKPLSAALRDNDQIYGVIKSSAINHAGKTNGYTVPSPNAQAEVIKNAFARSSIDVSTIGYIEAHGTGTSLGDPIEIAGLNKAFSELTEKPFDCRIGSVKSNIGHCESAAGIAGITKVLLQMKNQKLVPSLHSDTLNPNIDFSTTPLQVQKHFEDWKHLVQSGEIVPYRAGISSFGAGGSNAHVLIEEYPVSSPVTSTMGMLKPLPVMLSAASSDQLLEMVKMYLSWFENGQLANISLVNIAYTLQVGRRALPERLVIVAQSIPELIDKLNQYVSGYYSHGVFSTNVKAHRGKNAENVKPGGIKVDGFEEYPWLLEWCTGGKVSGGHDWFRGLAYHRVSLPVYPFKRERYWYTSIEGVSGAAEKNTVNYLHPLVHRNISDFSGIRYESHFSGQETFFRDHKVNGQRLLPGVAYLEIAIQAIKYANKMNPDFAACLMVEKVLWKKAIEADASGCDISVNLTNNESGKYVDISVSQNGLDPHPGMTARVLVNETPVLANGHDNKFNALDALEKLGNQSGQYYRIDSSRLYSEFSSHGIDYGASHQLVQEVFVGNDRLLARIELSAERQSEIDEYALHPGLMDSSLQTIKAFYMSDGDNRLMVPFSCERMQVYAELSSELWVDCSRNNDGVGHNFDIDIWNSKGDLSVQLKKISVMPFKATGQLVNENNNNVLSFAKNVKTSAHSMKEIDSWNQYLIPHWSVLEQTFGEGSFKSEGRTLVVTLGDYSIENSSLQSHAGAYIALEGTSSIEEIIKSIENAGEFEEIVCLAASASMQPDTGSGIEISQPYRKLIANQKNITQQCFNFIKALLQSGYDNRSLGLKLVTTHSLSVLPEEVVDPVCSGLHGLFGCLAKEYRNWNVRAVDTDSIEDLPLNHLTAMADMADGVSVAYRSGQWFRQTLYPYYPETVQADPYRHGGVYIVIGGAGGLGQTWSAMMIRRYQAHIIWIGRRDYDEQIGSSIEHLSKDGPAPWYISADASDPQQMTEVLSKIKMRHKNINGVVHSALVLKDRSLARMSQEEFQSSLATKVDISVCLAEVFETEGLDFALFFSSLISFTRNPGQANYATGSVFEDVFATHLDKLWPCKVRVINWGYWGEVGAVSGEIYRQRMEKAGILSIQTDSAMEAVRNLLNGDDTQLGFIRIDQNAKIDGVDSNFRIERFDGLENVLASIKEKHASENRYGSDNNLSLNRICQLDKQYNAELEERVIPLLCVQLREAGIFHGSGLPAIDVDQLVNRIKLINPSANNLAMHESWLRYSIEIIQKAGYLKAAHSGNLSVDPVMGLDADKLWIQWEEYCLANQHNNYVAAKARLLDVLLRALPNILCGKTKATDVVFPGSSMSLVEGVYKNNEVSDYFNEDVALSVCSAIQSWQEQVPGARLRILEIGAGTGGTTAGLLKKLSPYAGFIDEYCYTDVSRAFLNHAETHYAPENKFLKTRILNIESSPLDQGFDPGSYDIVVAAQVLHATESISRTLSNVKMLLKRNGLLILNELSERSVFSHLTFGMLEGWWLYQDASVRMPFSPGLFPDSWKRCLTGQGYPEVYFPTPESHVLGQQIIIAASDGYNRVGNKMELDYQDRRTTVIEAAERQSEKKEASSVKVSSIAESSNEALLEYIKATITGALSDALKVPVEAIDPQETFSEYGLDSITGVGVAQKISSLLEIELNTTVLFDYVSVEQLADYVMELSPAMPSEAVSVANKSGDASELVAVKEASADKVSPIPESSYEALLEYIKTTITGALSDALKVPVDAIDPQETFSEYGLDSITGVGVAQKISSLLEIELNTTVLFDYVSVEQLADYISGLSPALPAVPESVVLKSGDSLETAPESGSNNISEPVINMESQSSAHESHVLASSSYSSESIAVIGMSGRFPGSNNVEELWENIANGVDLITPMERWDMSKYKSLSEDFCAEGGFLSDIGQFDPVFFNISGTEATYMDPQQRLFLQESWKALEDAGYAGDTSFNDKAGVYVGCNSGDYKNIISEDAPAQAFWGNAGSITPARISYHLNLNGPAVAVDTACSSSLVAIHLACQGLWSGELDVALAGGVFVQSTPEFYLSADKAGMLSKRGRCQAFDSSADGFVPSEGVGVLVLKRLADALADGDHIHGVIKGSGINQDGASNGITAPSAKSQQKLIAAVYNRFSIKPENIQMVEAHGTGTSLGDPIESEGLKASYRREGSSSVDLATTKTCALGSIKSNMGHAITAAGVASVIKVLMSLKNRKIPPTIQFNELNPKINLNNSPFYVNTRLVDWNQPENSRRMAAVSSFGFSGTNGHLVLEEAPVAQIVACEKPKYLFALSAASEGQLKSMAGSLIKHCEESDVDVAGASFTLLNGRRHSEYRLAFVAGNKTEMISALNKYIQGEDDEVYISGHFDKKAFVKKISLQTYAKECISRYKQEMSPEICHELLTVIADLYIQGYSIPFKDLFSVSECRRVPLPTYPFSKREYWVAPVDKPALDKCDDEELPLQWMFTKSAFEPCPFDEIEDWSALVRALEGKNVYVLGDEAQTSEFKALIDQLCVKASLSIHPSVTSMTYENAVAVQELDVLPDYILCIDTHGKKDREQLAGLKALFQLLKCTMQANWNKAVSTYYIYDNHEAGNGIYLEAMSGFYESVAQENDLYTFTLIQYDQENQHQTQLQLLLLEVLQDDGLEKPVENIKYRNNERFVERHLEYTDREEHDAGLPINTNIALQTGKTYLITGGFGPVGRLLCEHLVKRYDSNLIVLSRSPMDDDKSAICEKLNENAGNVYYYSVDICDREALNRTLDSVRKEIGPIHGVIHMARMVHDNLLVAKSWNEFSATIEAKVWGTVNLDECLAQDSLDFFVLFSSIAAFGLRGSSDYGYSAAFQNSYARYRNRLLEKGLRSGVTVSQCWAGWTVDRYMPDSRMDIIKDNGMQPITINDAMGIFSESLNLNEPVIGLIGVTDRSKARKFFHIEQPATIQVDDLDSEGLDALLSEWLSKKDSLTKHEQIEMKESAVKLLSKFDVDALSDSVVKKIYSLMFADEVHASVNVSPVENDQYKHNKDDENDIRAIVFETIKKALMIDDLVSDEKLQHYGMDSVSAMQISSRLSNKLGLPIEPIWLLDNPTIDLFSNYLESKLEDVTPGSKIKKN